MRNHRFKPWLIFLVVLLATGLYSIWVWNEKLGDVSLFQHIRKRFLDEDIPKTHPSNQHNTDLEEVWGP